MKKILLTLFAVLSIIGVGTLTLKTVSAEDSTDERPKPFEALIQKIADKFGLDSSEVQVVFDEYQSEHKAEMEANREERQADMEAKFEEKLSEAVANGEITEEQKALIIAKRQELQANREANSEEMKNMTDEERKAAIEARRQELEAWAEENGIDVKYLLDFGMMRDGGPGVGHGPRGEKPSAPVETEE